MKIFTSVLAVLLLCYVTSTEGGFLDKLKIKIKIPKFTFGIPRTIPSVIKFPYIPTTPKTTKVTTKATTPTTTTTPRPPSTTEPTTPKLKSADELMIDECLESMSKCEWTAEELLEKMEELFKFDTGEFSGEGDSVGPVVDPNSISTKEVTIGATKIPGIIGIGTAAKTTTSISKLPKACSPFCSKSEETRYYVIDCQDYLTDETLKWHYQRRNAVLGCLNVEVNVN
uniref:uncharacterized protein LOC120348394 n=1 Tax=Styela clava TaxID=7725 RepID=UPI00193A66DC|nr:uncharacterized protein LOC120348394 [Styela clava]